MSLEGTLPGGTVFTGGIGGGASSMGAGTVGVAG